MLRSVPDPEPTSTARPEPTLDLLADKAWEHLGLTGQEFRRGWFAGQYRTDPRAEVVALDQLMRTGVWNPTAARQSRTGTASTASTAAT